MTNPSSCPECDPRPCICGRVCRVCGTDRHCLECSWVVEAIPDTQAPTPDPEMIRTSALRAGVPEAVADKMTSWAEDRATTTGTLAREARERVTVRVLAAQAGTVAGLSFRVAELESALVAHGQRQREAVLTELTAANKKLIRGAVESERAALRWIAAMLNKAKDNPGEVTDFVHAELLGELLDLWAWFVDDERDKTRPDLRMNAVGNEIRRRIMKLQGHTDEEIERDL